MFRAKTKTEIILDSINSLAQTSSLTQLSPGSKARALIEAIAQVVGNVSADVSDGIMQTLLTDATGATLDLIAESYGIQRLQQIPPRVESGDSNLKYYVKRGTFGDINNGLDITIPRGTQIRTDNDSLSVYFIQRDEVTLSSVDNSTYFSADQVGQNFGGSISPLSLSKHNFTGYADAVFNSLLVTNEKGVAGRPPESDANLRFRLRKQMTAAATGNQTSVRIAALAVPGVSDIRILPYRAGLGTFDIVVYGISPSVSNSILTEVQQRVDRVSATGSRAIVVPPRLVGISLTTNIKFRANTTQSQKNRAILGAENAIRRYINDLTPGQDLIINILVQNILSVSDQIADIGTPGKPFQELYIWKQNGPNARRYSRKLETNYKVKEDEDLVVEPFIELPIRIIEGL